MYTTAKCTSFAKRPIHSPTRPNGDPPEGNKKGSIVRKTVLPSHGYLAVDTPGAIAILDRTGFRPATATPRHRSATCYLGAPTSKRTGRTGPVEF
ncbi:alpha-taxilin isoform X1 [Anopheles sinensis]|uniref:Alpha-taxilin isoform X1 n=1 Tax=Anopheles sinensis TaxID=74873 RepID=A0A084WDU5_ANOSI|nr:alpha-taxilin isoform X1 [Anopheles sinensis]